MVFLRFFFSIVEAHFEFSMELAIFESSFVFCLFCLKNASAVKIAVEKLAFILAFFGMKDSFSVEFVFVFFGMDFTGLLGDNPLFLPYCLGKDFVKEGIAVGNRKID